MVNYILQETISTYSCRGERYMYEPQTFHVGHIKNENNEEGYPKCLSQTFHRSWPYSDCLGIFL